MDIWKILDINPTRDLKAIKKAYARLSVKYHPEEHPEEFRQLNDAYKAAVKYAKGSLTAQTIPGPSPASVFPVSENEKNIHLNKYFAFSTRSFFSTDRSD